MKKLLSIGYFSFFTFWFFFYEVLIFILFFARLAIWALFFKTLAISIHGFSLKFIWLSKWVKLTITCSFKNPITLQQCFIFYSNFSCGCSMWVGCDSWIVLNMKWRSKDGSFFRLHYVSMLLLGCFGSQMNWLVVLCDTLRLSLVCYCEFYCLLLCWSLGCTKELIGILRR